jgi:hypothetical protein
MFSLKIKLSAPPPPEEPAQEAPAPAAPPPAAPLSEEELARIAEKKRRKKERKERERAEAAAAAAAAEGGAAPGGQPRAEDESVSLGKRKRDEGAAAAAAAAPPRGPRKDPVLRDGPGAPGEKDRPKANLLEQCLNKLVRRDKEGFFQEPVTDALAPGYSAVVHTPMDLSTMRKKARAGQYDSWEDVAADVELIVKNCLAYNQADTVFAAAARRFETEARGVVDSYKAPPPKPAPEVKPRSVAALPNASVAKPAAPQVGAAPTRPGPRAAAGPQAGAMPSSYAGARGVPADENKRGTFKPRGGASRLPSLYGALPLLCYSQTLPVQQNGPPAPVAFRQAQAPFAPDGFARSLSRFAAWLGPRGRALAMERVAGAVDPLPAQLPTQLLPQWPRAQTVLQGVPTGR